MHPRRNSFANAAVSGSATSTAILAAVLFVTCTQHDIQADTLYASTHDGTIEVFDMAGSRSLFVSTGLANPRGLAIDSAGNLYVANYGDNTIQKYNLEGVSLGLFANTGLSNPQGLAFDSVGNLYAANAGDNTITRFTSEGIGTVFASIGMSQPSGIAFDNAGNLYVSSYGNSTIEKLSAEGLDLGTIVGTGLSSPLGLVFDDAGVLYVATQGTHKIETFTSDGVHLGTFANNNLDYPFGLAFDSAGNLYAANAGDYSISKFTPDGLGSFFADTGNGNNPTFIAIQRDLIVPEPSTGALLNLAALALLTRDLRLHLARRRTSTEEERNCSQV